MNEAALTNALSRLDAVKDVMTVQRVFGEPTQIDGVTVVPVAVVRGGAGGGGGGGTTPEKNEQGEGAGVGFGVNTRAGRLRRQRRKRDVATRCRRHAHRARLATRSIRGDRCRRVGAPTPSPALTPRRARRLACMLRLFHRRGEQRA